MAQIFRCIVGFHLRPYQKLALQAIAASWERVDRTLIQMATGAGKTVVFAQVLHQRLRGTNRQGFVLVHRQELLHQAVTKIRQVWPQADVGIMQRQQVELDRQVVVASIPSLYRRLGAVDLPRIDVVVVDEAHHAPARSWQHTIDTLTSAGAKCLGVTATPERDKRVGLGAVFEELCFTRSLPDLVPEYLCDLRAIRLETQLELDGVRSRQGDFVASDLERAVNTPARNQLLVEGWMRYGEGRPAVVYCASVPHALDVAATFQEFGIAAGTVYGQQSAGDRQAVLAQFQSGQLPILTNCLVLTEGWDYPDLQCLILARPTQSSLLFTQMLGRGTRQAPQKTDCLILDIADNTKRHQLQTIHRLFGLTSSVDLYAAGVVQRIQEQQQAEMRRLRSEATLLHRMEVAIVELLLGVETPLPSSYSWTPLSKGCWFLTIPEREPKYAGNLLQIRYDPDTGASLLHVTLMAIAEIAAAPSLPHLVEIADEWIERHLRFAAILLASAADWRGHPASDMQKSYIRSLLRRLEPVQPQLYEQVATQLQQIESAETLQAFYAEQGAAIPDSLDRRRLTKGIASNLIAFLKEQVVSHPTARSEPS